MNPKSKLGKSILSLSIESAWSFSQPDVHSDREICAGLELAPSLNKRIRILISSRGSIPRCSDSMEIPTIIEKVKLQHRVDVCVCVCLKVVVSVINKSWFQTNPLINYITYRPWMQCLDHLTLLYHQRWRSLRLRQPMIHTSILNVIRSYAICNMQWETKGLERGMSRSHKWRSFNWLNPIRCMLVASWVVRRQEVNQSVSQSMSARTCIITFTIYNLFCVCDLWHSLSYRTTPAVSSPFPFHVWIRVRVVWDSAFRSVWSRRRILSLIGHPIGYYLLYRRAAFVFDTMRMNVCCCWMSMDVDDDEASKEQIIYSSSTYLHTQ